MEKIKSNEEILHEQGAAIKMFESDYPNQFSLVLKAMDESNKQAVKVALIRASKSINKDRFDWETDEQSIIDCESEILKLLK